MARTTNKINRDIFLKEVQNFFKEAQNVIDETGKNALSLLAPDLMQAIIDNVGFDDYTGVLANSYVMAMVVNGKVAPSMSIQTSKYEKQQASKYIYISSISRIRRLNQWNSETLHRRGLLKNMTSIKEPITAYDFRTRKGRYDKRRSAGSWGRRLILKNRFSRKGHPKFISVPKSRWEEDYPNGVKSYGHSIAEIQGAYAGPKKGSGLVITNGAPYAQRIHNGTKPSQVLPLSSMRYGEIQLVTIMKNELRKIKVRK